MTAEVTQWLWLDPGRPPASSVCRRSKAIQRRARSPFSAPAHGAEVAAMYTGVTRNGGCLVTHGFSA